MTGLKLSCDTPLSLGQQLFPTPIYTAKGIMDLEGVSIQISDFVQLPNGEYFTGTKNPQHNRLLDKRYRFNPANSQNKQTQRRQAHSSKSRIEQKAKFYLL